MIVTAEAAAALPARLRPTPEQVCNWYAHTLGVMGAEVSRTASDQLEFMLPLTSTFFDADLTTSLAPLAAGELEVSETADGFEVTVRARARNWVGFLPLAVFAGAAGGLLFAGAPVGWFPAGLALALLGFTWLRTWGALDRFLFQTNGAIADSFAAVPPPPHGQPPARRDADRMPLGMPDRGPPG